VTGPGRPLWGFCETCERWQFSAAWGEPAACPDCGTAPRPLERWADGAGRIMLMLDLPPGGDLPLLG
jgi:hypothetical protein